MKCPKCGKEEFPNFMFWEIIDGELWLVCQKCKIHDNDPLFDPLEIKLIEEVS